MDPTQQQLLLTAGGKADPVYIDDVFSTYLWTGNQTARSINNGINLTKGGLVWVKSRNDTHQNHLFDTVRGANQMIASDSNSDQATVSNRVTGFNANGFDLGTAGQVNGSSSYEYASWTFRKQRGFFDVVTYSGTNSAKTVPHNLGCVPGCIMVKRLDDPGNWVVYHLDAHSNNPAGYYLQLDTDTGVGGASNRWNDTPPTANEFTVGTAPVVNSDGASYIAYLWAGGDSSHANAKSVNFDGNEGIDVPASSDLLLGTGRFCIEGWVFLDDAPGSGSPSYARIFQLDGPSGNNDSENLQITVNPSNYTIGVQSGGSGVVASSASQYIRGSWNHIALTRYSNTITLYLNGKSVATTSWAGQFSGNGGYPRVRLGYLDQSSNGVFNGKISNWRITTNEEVYTGDFIPSTEPLTTTSQVISSSNVKLLCCNGPTTTSATVTPATLTATGTPTVSTKSPFVDPVSSKFGTNEDQSVIRCGKYTGETNADPEVYLGWEPQFVIIKSTNPATINWALFDSMRGIVAEGDERYLYPNLTNSEYVAERISATPTGFKVDSAGGVLTNADGNDYIFIAIRRPDALAGKPAEVGTDVFAMDIGSGSSTIPNFDSGFPVDFQFAISPGSTSLPRYVGSRLTQDKLNYLNTAASETGASDHVYYSNVGWNKYSGWGHNYQAWMWKRHAGFDVVALNPEILIGSGVHVRHSLGQIPEMIWAKNRSQNAEWSVYHKQLNGGSSPWEYRLKFTNDGEQNTTSAWNDIAPTATHFTAGAWNCNTNMLFMLFASVEGICKVGSYVGQGSDQTIEFGFQPRFIIVRRRDAAGDWNMYDTVRGLVSGADKELRMNATATQTNHELGDVTSTGFTFACGGSHDTCSAGKEFLYYAHA